MRNLLLSICLFWPSLASAALWQCQANLQGMPRDTWLNYSLNLSLSGHFSAVGEVMGPDNVLPFVWEGTWAEDGAEIAMIGRAAAGGKTPKELKAYSTTREADVMIFQLVDEAKLAQRRTLRKLLADALGQRGRDNAQWGDSAHAPKPDLVRCLLTPNASSE